MNNGERVVLLKVLRGLMFSENMGDVHDQINRLTNLLGLERLEGFNDHWTERDWGIVDHE